MGRYWAKTSATIGCSRVWGGHRRWNLGVFARPPELRPPARRDRPEHAQPAQRRRHDVYPDELGRQMGLVLDHADDALDRDKHAEPRQRPAHLGAGLTP